MKRLLSLTGLAAATILAGCSKVTPVEPSVATVVPIATTNGAQLAVVSPAMVTTGYAATASGLQPITAPILRTPSIIGGSPYSGGAPENTSIVNSAAVLNPVSATPVTTTPMAVHAGVPTPYGVSNAVVYDGHNGVRPFLVQSGAVWNGPSTYMLPLGATPGTHQHVETVSADYTSVGHTMVSSTPAKSHATTNVQLSLRKQPNHHSQTCVAMPAGARVEVGDCANGWCSVTYKKWSGYARQKHMTMVN